MTVSFVLCTLCFCTEQLHVRTRTNRHFSVWKLTGAENLSITFKSSRACRSKAMRGILQSHACYPRSVSISSYRNPRSISILSAGLFETDAVLIPGTRCDYQIDSVSIPGNTTTRGHLTIARANHRGRFYSPQYPSTYPKSIKCAYIFNGQPNERVKLVFEHIRLQKSDLR